MEKEALVFFKVNPEGAVIVALDDQKDGLLFGAVELQGGTETWLDYELEFTLDNDTVSLYRQAEDTPVLIYHVRKRQVDVVAPPDRMLILWNRSRRALAVDGDSLSPGEVFASVPEGTTPWMLRFACWLPRGEEDHKI